MIDQRKAFRLGERVRITQMDFNLFGNANIKSPQDLAERRALVRSLMERQMSQRPHDMWDGINNLVGAISGRVAESQLDNAENEGQAAAESTWKPFNQALLNKQTPDLGMLTGVLSSPWLNPGQRSVAEDLYKQQLDANRPMTQHEKALLAIEEKKLAQSRGTPKPY